MNIFEATARYEKWMAAHLSIVRADLQYKHVGMASSPFAFLRATFYRWCQVWPDLFPESRRAPAVLAIGDLHIENFGTWRDMEGRLVWGINDFDEAATLPYTLDLLRLATSAYLKSKMRHLSTNRREICRLILDGYGESLRSGGMPFVLDEEHGVLRQLALGELRDPAQFWSKMRKLPTFRKSLSKDQREALECLLPEEGTAYQIKTRRSGLGSLGRRRLVALAEWRGGLVAREIKAALPSAALWARGREADSRVRYEEIIRNCVRVPDPFVHLHDKWIVRRLAPDCSRIELASLPGQFDEAEMFHAMGYETANIHLGSSAAIAKIQRDLKGRTAKWLHESARAAAKFIVSEWREWRSSG